MARILWDPAREPITVPRLRQWVQDAGFGEIETFALTQRSTGLVARKVPVRPKRRSRTAACSVRMAAFEPIYCPAEM